MDVKTEKSLAERMRDAARGLRQQDGSISHAITMLEAGADALDGGEDLTPVKREAQEWIRKMDRLFVAGPVVFDRQEVLELHSLIRRMEAEL